MKYSRDTEELSTVCDSLDILYTLHMIRTHCVYIAEVLNVCFNRPIKILEYYDFELHYFLLVFPVGNVKKVLTKTALFRDVSHKERALYFLAQYGNNHMYTRAYECDGETCCVCVRPCTCLLSHGRPLDFVRMRCRIYVE